MTKEVAVVILKKKHSELKQAEIILEMYENGVRELREDIENLEAIINKKDDWRLIEVPDSWQELYEEKALLMADMMHFAHVRNEGWEADWESRYEEKYGVVHEKYGVFKARCRITCNSFVFGVSVKSQEIAREMFEVFGERIEEICNKQY